MLRKTVVIDGKKVEFKASAAVPRIYRMKFRRDLFVDLQKVAKSVDKKGKKKDKEDTSKADKVYCFELINKGADNNIFYVYLIDDKVYLYSDEFASSLNTFINGYADETTVEQVESLIK